MPAILEALNQAALCEQTTGGKVDVIAVSDEMYYKILRLGIVSVYHFGSSIVILPASL